MFSLAFLTMAMSPRGGNLTPDGKILWETGTRLSWDDFQGRPDRASNMLAMTESGIDFSYYCDGSYFRVEILAKFDPSKSWRKKTASDKLLPHEQLHFDITEWISRKMRKAFAELENPCQMGKRKLEGIAQEHFNEWQRVQMQYDRETEHSIDREKQQEWEEKVAQGLKSLEKYAL